MEIKKSKSGDVNSVLLKNYGFLVSRWVQHAKKCSLLNRIGKNFGALDSNGYVSI